MLNDQKLEGFMLEPSRKKQKKETAIMTFSLKGHFWRSMMRQGRRGESLRRLGRRSEWRRNPYGSQALGWLWKRNFPGGQHGWRLRLESGAETETSSRRSELQAGNRAARLDNGDRETIVGAGGARETGGWCSSAGSGDGSSISTKDCWCVGISTSCSSMKCCCNLGTGDPLEHHQYS